MTANFGEVVRSIPDKVYRQMMEKLTELDPAMQAEISGQQIRTEALRAASRITAGWKGGTATALERATIDISKVFAAYLETGE